MCTPGNFRCAEFHRTVLGIPVRESLLFSRERESTQLLIWLRFYVLIGNRIPAQARPQRLIKLRQCSALIESAVRGGEAFKLIECERSACALIASFNCPKVSGQKGKGAHRCYLKNVNKPIGKNVCKLTKLAETCPSVYA